MASSTHFWGVAWVAELEGAVEGWKTDFMMSRESMDHEEHLSPEIGSPRRTVVFRLH